MFLNNKKLFFIFSKINNKENRYYPIIPTAHNNPTPNYPIAHYKPNPFSFFFFLLGNLPSLLLFFFSQQNSSPILHLTLDYRSHRFNFRSQTLHDQQLHCSSALSQTTTHSRFNGIPAQTLLDMPSSTNSLTRR